MKRSRCKIKRREAR